MARFAGKVGYGESQETPTGSGKWVDLITELQYYGDVINNSRNLDNSQEVNDNISVGNSISIVADEYAVKNFLSIRYIWWNGYPWEVTKVVVQSPRLILTLGKIWNGPFPPPEEP